MSNDLVQIVDRAVADAYARAGAHMACRPGCIQCCIGVFGISHQDAGRLRAGLEHLALTHPQRAAALRTRVAASIARLAPHFPGDSGTGILDTDIEDSPEFEDFANDEPCPVLDPATQTCDLYTHRPILCRTFGPPSRTEEGDLATCELCFTNATTEQIAACELDPSLPYQQLISDKDFDHAHNLFGQTLIAYALRNS